MLRPCYELVRCADVLSRSGYDACRPQTRKKANALYLDVPSHAECKDRPSLSDRDAKHRNVWVDMSGPKTRTPKSATHKTKLQYFFSPQAVQ